MKAWRSPSSFPFAALGLGLIVSVFVACGDDSDSSDGGASGSRATAGSGGSRAEGGGGGTTPSDGGEPTSGGTSSNAGTGGAVDGDAGEPNGGTSGSGGSGGTDAAGAGAGGTDTAGTGGTGGTGGTSGSGGMAGSGNTGNVSSIPGVPCDVAVTISQRCNVCHNDPPVLDAPYHLKTYDALAEHAEDVREVIENNLMPPPPMAPISEAERDALFEWIEAGTPITNGACE